MTALEAIIKEIDEKLSSLQDTVMTGRLASYEEYKALCGEIKGLLSIREYTKDLKQKLEYSDNE
mgnify:CR=1 FL=1